MAANQQFVDGVNNFIREAMSNADKIYKDSAADVARIANTPISQGGRMPVITGQLMDSLCVTTINGSSTGNSQVAVAIQGSPALSGLRIGWNAPYAEYVEFGLGSNIPRAFGRGAVSQWQSIVDFNAARINP